MSASLGMTCQAKKHNVTGISHASLVGAVPILNYLPSLSNQAYFLKQEHYPKVVSVYTYHSTFVEIYCMDMTCLKYQICFVIISKD